MSYIFLDESGDLGLDLRKPGATRFFIVTFLFVEKKRAIEKIISTLHGGLRKKYRMRTSVLHASKEESATIAKFCKKIASKGCRIMTIYLDKSKVYTKLSDEKHVLYNYIVNILLDRMINKSLVDKNKMIHLIASRRETNKFLNQNFQDYLACQIENNHNVEVKVEIKTPPEEKCLQAVDLISWSIFRKYERRDSSYYKLIQHLIVEENSLFK